MSSTIITLSFFESYPILEYEDTLFLENFKLDLLINKYYNMFELFFILKYKHLRLSNEYNYYRNGLCGIGNRDMFFRDGK